MTGYWREWRPDISKRQLAGLYSVTASRATKLGSRLTAATHRVAPGETSVFLPLCPNADLHVTRLREKLVVALAEMSSGRSVAARLRNRRSTFRQQSVTGRPR